MSVKPSVLSQLLLRNYWTDSFEMWLLGVVWLQQDVHEILFRSVKWNGGGFSLARFYEAVFFSLINIGLSYIASYISKLTEPIVLKNVILMFHNIYVVHVAYLPSPIKMAEWRLILVCKFFRSLFA